MWTSREGLNAGLAALLGAIIVAIIFLSLY